MALDLPKQLSESMADGRLVLFAGAGMSAPQLPGWRALLEQMLQWTREESISLASSHDEIRELIAEGRLLLAAKTLRSEIGEDNGFLQGVFRNSKLAPEPCPSIVAKR